MCILPSPGKRGALAADASLGALVRTVFGFEIVLVLVLVSQGPTFGPEAVTSAPGETQRRPKAIQSLVLGFSGRPFWLQFASLAASREPYYLLRFNDIRPPWGWQL